MKTILPFRPAAVTCMATAALLALAGCAKPKHDDLGTRVKRVYEEAKGAVTDAWADVKGYTYEKRTEFGAKARAMKSKMDDEVDQLRADYAESKASASRKAAMEEVRNAQADFKAKVDALGHASADTWDSAKQKVVAAWDRLEAAVKKARSD